MKQRLPLTWSPSRQSSTVSKSSMRPSRCTSKRCACSRRLPEKNAGEIAVALNDLGALYTQRGNSERAEELLSEPRTSSRKRSGHWHPDVAVTLNNLALVHKRRGNFDRARAIYQNALGIFEAALGPDHPKTLACRRNRDRCAADALARQSQAALDG